MGTPLVAVPTPLLLPVVEVAGGTPCPIGLAKVEFGWVATDDEWPDIPVVPEPAIPEL
jgi:hypothetical protein